MKKVLRIIKDRMKKRKEKKEKKGYKKKKKFAKLRKVIFWLAIIGLLIWAFTYFGKMFYGNKTQEQNYLIIEPVTKGEVSSSFTAEGTIKAEKKQDLNVYKKQARLNKVNIKNGNYVKKGDVLFVFDSSSLSNNLQRAYMSYQKALLDYNNQKVLSSINQDLNNSEVALTQFERILKRKKDEVEDLRKNFYSKNLDIVFDDKDKEFIKTKPVISGNYKSEKEGEYKIEVYSSSTESGYSFRYTGLENGVGSVYYGRELDLGKNGLKITFTNGAVKSGDKWILKVPNVEFEDYEDNKKKYKQALEDLVDFYKKNNVEFEASKQNLEYKKKVNGQNFDLREKRISLSEALNSYEDTRRNKDEMIIKAPFSGTINGMKDVVEGEKPKTTDDLMKLGTLISNDFVVEFALSITDLEKIKMHQEVKVVANIGSKTKNLEAVIEQIGALPSGGLYPIVAKIKNTDDVFLKEGVSATIHIVKESKKDVVRVPNQAISYDTDKKYVLKVIQNEVLKKEAKKENKSGIISLEENKVVSEKVFIKTGIVGKQYTEVTDGLKVGDKVVTTSEVKNVPKKQGQGVANQSGEYQEGDGGYDGGGEMYDDM